MSGVRRQLLTWAAFSLGLLLVSSMCGYLVRAVTPRPERYTPYPNYYVPPPPARVDLVNRPAPAFGKAMTPTPADAAEFAVVFDTLASAARAGDGNGYAALWDRDRTAEEVWALVARWTGNAPTDLQVRSTAQQLWETITKQGRERGGRYRFDRTELLKVARSRDGREALVVARHTATEDGAPTVYGVRWWLVRNTGGTWKVYDRDDPRGRLRATVRLAGYEWERVTGTFPGAARLDPEDGTVTGSSQVGSLYDAISYGAGGGTFELEVALEGCRGINLPPPLAALRAVAEVNLLIQKGDPQKALNLLVESAPLDPALPQTILVRGVVANRLGSHRAALRHLTEYNDAVGSDADAALQTGIAQEGLKQPAEALATFRAAVNDFPGHGSLYPALARALPAGRKREAGELAAKGPRPAEHLDAILFAPEADDMALADEVVTGFLAAKPDDPHGLTAAAVVRARQRNVSEATALLRKAREATADDERDQMREAYLSEVLRHGMPVAGYNAVLPADRSAAFRWLAELFDAGGRLERAEELFAAGMARLPRPALLTRKPLPGQPLVIDFTDDEVTWDEFRVRRVDCLFRLGRWRDAYRELPPAVYTFAQLAHELYGAGDVAGLEELMAMHKKVVPDDVEAIYWQGQVHWVRQQTRQAVDLFEEYRRRAKDMLTGLQALEADEKRVRGLVRLGRVEEARAVLEGSNVANMMWSLEAVVAAAAGDADRLGQVLARWAATPNGSAEFYADPDLGPLLRGDRFPELRAKYPPP